MALNFPNEPINGELYPDPNSDTVWEYHIDKEAWLRVPVAETTNDPFVHVGTTGSISLAAAPPQASGENNTVVGLDTGVALDACTNNTLMGTSAGKLLASSSYNAINGASAGKSLNTVDCNSNVIMGAEACDTNTHQERTVIVGAFARTKDSLSAIDEIVIGANAVGKGTGTAVIGDTNTKESEIKGVLTIGSYDVAAMPDPTKVGRLIIVTGSSVPSGFPVLAISVGTSWVNTMDGTDVTP